MTFGVVDLEPDRTHTSADAVGSAEQVRRSRVVAASTGMRWGELVGLRPVDVDLLHRNLRVEQTLIEVNGVLSVSRPKTPKSIRIRKKILDQTTRDVANKKAKKATEMVEA